MKTNRRQTHLLKSLLGVFFCLLRVNRPASPPKARLYVDAAAFDPQRARGADRAVILVARNNAKTISACVHEQLTQSPAVVVIDQGSTDATPHLAAEAGAVVLLRSR